MGNEILTQSRRWDGRERRHRDKWLRRIFIAWLVVFTVIVIWSVRAERNNTNKVRTLVQQNKERITDVQISRFQSCKETYESFHQVLDPFFPPSKKRTAEQQRDFTKFNRIIKKKIAQCRAQVTPPPLPKKVKR